MHSVLAGEYKSEGSWRLRDKKYGRERIRLLRHQKTYSVPQRGNNKEINRLYIMIHDNGAIVELDKMFAVRAIKEKSACIFTII